LKPASRCRIFCRTASGIQELLQAKQLGEDQQGVLDSVKEYYGEVRRALLACYTSTGCWSIGSTQLVPVGRGVIIV
jgi:hypothetical protein